jgi:hypothetical protein
MYPVDSDKIPLESLPRIQAPKPWRRNIETLAIVSCLFLGGVGTGFVWATRNAEAQVTQMRGDHIRELERLSKSHEFAISALSKGVAKAADSVAVASEQASAAAEAVGDVAGKVDAAATKADKAARLAASKASAKAPPPAAVQPEVVNQEIRRANERIKERK